VKSTPWIFETTWVSKLRRCNGREHNRVHLIPVLCKYETLSDSKFKRTEAHWTFYINVYHLTGEIPTHSSAVITQNHRQLTLCTAHCLNYELTACDCIIKLPSPHRLSWVPSKLYFLHHRRQYCISSGDFFDPIPTTKSVLSSPEFTNQFLDPHHLGTQPRAEHNFPCAQGSSRSVCGAKYYECEAI